MVEKAVQRRPQEEVIERMSIGEYVPLSRIREQIARNPKYLNVVSGLSREQLISMARHGRSSFSSPKIEAIKERRLPGAVHTALSALVPGYYATTAVLGLADVLKEEVLGAKPRIDLNNQQKKTFSTLVAAKRIGVKVPSNYDSILQRAKENPKPLALRVAAKRGNFGLQNRKR